MILKVDRPVGQQWPAGEVPVGPGRRAQGALQKDRTRARILEAAQHVFATKGYHRALMDDVAREAGLSKGALYFHFPSKEELFLSLVEDAAEQLAQRVLEAIEGARGGEAKVRAALRAAVTAFSENEALTRLVLVEWVGLGPAFHGKRFALQRALADLIRAQLDRAMAEGDIPPQDTELAAFAWIGAIQELVIRWLVVRQPPQLQDLVPGLSTLLLRSVGFSPEGSP